jgi:23S rRNA maturation-related 3'-5' exoribonuclease YhaM
VNLLEDFYDVEHIIVLKNNEKILDLVFKDLEFKNKFKYYNAALDNSSIHK